MIIDAGRPIAVAAVEAIHRGDVSALRQLLADHPDLATARLGPDGPGGMTRSLLHVATDWPGHYPNGVATVAALIDAGADVHARFTGPHTETPLHWAASRQTTAEYLLDRGGDLNWIGHDQLTPLDAARRSDADQLAGWLVERGAKPAAELRSTQD